MEQPKNYPSPPAAKQPKNSQADTRSIAHVVYPRIQWHNLFLTTKVIDTKIHTKKQMKKMKKKREKKRKNTSVSKETQ